MTGEENKNKNKQKNNRREKFIINNQRINLK